MKDMCALFSQLARPELTGETIQDEVVEHHYEKYKYFYRLLNPLSDNIKSVEYMGSEDKQKITFIVKLKKKSNKGKFIYELEMHEHPDFKLYISEEGNTLNISIENKNISREDEIYEDRPDTN